MTDDLRKSQDSPPIRVDADYPDCAYIQLGPLRITVQVDLEGNKILLTGSKPVRITGVAKSTRASIVDVAISLEPLT